MKSNGDSIMKQEIDKIEPMINYTNELLSNLMNKNYQNTTISPMTSNNSKKGKSVEKRIDMLEVYKTLLQNLKSDKIGVSDVRNQLKIKDNFNKNEMVQYLTNKIKKMESDRKREAYIANQKRKARLEEMKIKMQLAKTEAERRKIQDEENARIANENKIKADELARIESDKAEKLRIELADENDLKNNYKIIGYFNGVLTLKNTEKDTKIKIYKNTKVKNWTFLNWKESSMEATFEKNGKFITKKLKQSMDNVPVTKEEIGEPKTSTNEVIGTGDDTTGTQKK
jgi:hypothetical protein